MNSKELEQKINIMLKPENLECQILGGLLDESRFKMRVLGKYGGIGIYTEADYAVGFLTQLASGDYSFVIAIKTDFECLSKHITNQTKETK